MIGKPDDQWVRWRVYGGSKRSSQIGVFPNTIIQTPDKLIDENGGMYIWGNDYGWYKANIYYHGECPDSKLIIRNGIGFPIDLIGQWGTMEEIFDSITLMKQLQG